MASLFFVLILTLGQNVFAKDFTREFERPPLAAHIQLGSQDFVLLGLHAKPDKVVSELNFLDDAFEHYAKKYKDQDGILLGDLNADCSYLSYEEERELDLWQNDKFQWWISRGEDTTVSHNSCAYDRILSTGDLPLRNAGVATRYIPKRVSDHYPIQIELYEKRKTYRVGAWNIKVLGQKKSSSSKVMEKIREVAAPFDVLLLQEIRDASGVVIERIKNLLGNRFHIFVSERLGRSSYKEKYVLLVRKRRAKLLQWNGQVSQ